MRLVVGVPQAFAGIRCGHPPRLEGKLHMAVTQEHFGPVVVPIAYAVYPTGWKTGFIHTAEIKSFQAIGCNKL